MFQGQENQLLLHKFVQSVTCAMGFNLQYQQSEQRETALPVCLLKYKKKIFRHGLPIATAASIQWKKIRVGGQSFEVEENQDKNFTDCPLRQSNLSDGL